MSRALGWAVAGFLIPVAFGCSLAWAFIWAVATAAIGTIGA